MDGKEKCRRLRAMRERIARANELDYCEKECGHEGPCAGTCPYCEAQARALERELSRRASLGRRVAVAGLCVGMAAAVSGCSAVDAAADAIRALVPHRAQTEEPVELEGEIAVTTTDAPEPAELEGKVAVEPAETPEPVQLEGEIAADGSVVSGQ